jgi:hypothetical protein
MNVLNWLESLIVCSLLTNSYAVTADQASDDLDEQISQLLQPRQQLTTSAVPKNDNKTLKIIGAGVGAAVTAIGIGLARRSDSRGFFASPSLYGFAAVGAVIEVADELSLVANDKDVEASPVILGSKALIGGVKGAMIGTLVTLTGRQIAHYTKQTGQPWLSNPKSLLAVALTTALGASIGSDLISGLMTEKKFTEDDA